MEFSNTWMHCGEKMRIRWPFLHVIKLQQFTILICLSDIYGILLERINWRWPLFAITHHFVGISSSVFRNWTFPQQQQQWDSIWTKTRRLMFSVERWLLVGGEVGSIVSWHPPCCHHIVPVPVTPPTHFVSPAGIGNGLIKQPTGLGALPACLGGHWSRKITPTPFIQASF